MSFVTPVQGFKRMNARSPSFGLPDMIRAQLCSPAETQSLQKSVASGHSSLDAELPGRGWPIGCVTELLVRALGVGELRLLAPALSRLAQANKNILLLAPPQLPYGPALAALGLPPERFVVVRAPEPADRLWAIEQSLKSQQFGALLAWLPNPTRPEHIRRFQLAARFAQGPVFLFRPLSAQAESSAAPLRIALLPRQYPGLGVHILKRRGPVQIDPILVNLPLASRALRPLQEHDQPVRPNLASTGMALPQGGPAHALDRLSVPSRVQ